VKHLRILFVVCALFGIVALNAGCGDGADAAANKDTNEAASVTPVVGFEIGNTAPNFILKDMNGEALELSALRGKVVLVDFWDTWCPPCIKAMPHLQELHMETKDQDIVIVAIAGGRKGESAVDSFVKKNGYTFTTAVGDRSVFEAYNVSSIPATYIIAADGKIHAKWVGGKSKKEYEAAVHAAGTSH
jgi:peroxiredoxin